MSITIHLSPDVESSLLQQAFAAGIPPAEFVVDVLTQRLGQSPISTPPGFLLSNEESRLLEAINQGLPESVWQRYYALIARRQAETLTAAEQHELIKLSDQIENANATRLQQLQRLARLRGVTLQKLMDQLGIYGSIHA